MTINELRHGFMERELATAAIQILRSIEALPCVPHRTDERLSWGDIVMGA